MEIRLKSVGVVLYEQKTNYSDLMLWCACIHGLHKMPEHLYLYCSYIFFKPTYLLVVDMKTLFSDVCHLVVITVWWEQTVSGSAWTRHSWRPYVGERNQCVTINMKENNRLLLIVIGWTCCIVKYLIFKSWLNLKLNEFESCNL